MYRLLILIPFFALGFSGGKTFFSEAKDTQILTSDTLVRLEKRPKNIIFMIGDGMGLTQITAAMYSSNQPLAFERFPVTGLIKTHASNNLITDSAAGATAFSCGCKTYNGAIGIYPDKKPCTTIVEEAKKYGYAVGLVATSSITHATPAAFIAHAKDRGSMEEIATWFLTNESDLLIGGGLKHFNHRKKDNRNLYQELEAKGYFVTDYTDKKLVDLNPSPSRPFVWFSADDQPESVMKGRDYLPIASKLAPNFLKSRNTKGFYLMIEGSQIDWGGHAMNANYIIKETLDFDKCIKEVLDFAEEDGETLVVVTADHETGGMAILHGSTRENLDIKFNTDYHTATLIPVFAFGPGAEKFSGVYDNTDIHKKMKELLEFPVLTTSR
jgi:alkaline phosphatase